MSVFMHFLVPNLYWDDCVELCGDKRGSHWADCGFHVVMDFPVQHLHVARYALSTDASFIVKLHGSALLTSDMRAQFSLFRFDSAFSCAAEEIWESERFPSGVLLCRLGVSQLVREMKLNLFAATWIIDKNSLEVEYKYLSMVYS